MRKIAERRTFTMRDFNITLCSYKTDWINVSVWAKMENGVLTIAGEDYGKRVEQLWGDDYEYFYNFDEPNTMRLLELIGGMTPRNQR